MLTSFDREDLLFESLQAGATGYALKGMNAEDLLAAIRTVHAGDVCIQRATNLVWSNRSDTVCRIAFVLIDGKQ